MENENQITFGTDNINIVQDGPSINVQELLNRVVVLEKFVNDLKDKVQHISIATGGFGIR